MCGGCISGRRQRIERQAPAARCWPQHLDEVEVKAKAATTVAEVAADTMAVKVVGEAVAAMADGTAKKAARAKVGPADRQGPGEPAWRCWFWRRPPPISTDTVSNGDAKVGGI